MLDKAKNLFKESFVKRLVVLICFFNIILIVLFTLMTYFITRINTSSDVNESVEKSLNTAVRNVEDFLDDCSQPLKIAADCSALKELQIDPSNSALAADVLDIFESSVSENSSILAMWCVDEETGSVVGTGIDNKQVALSEYAWYNDMIYQTDSMCSFYLIDSQIKGLSGSDADLLAIVPIVNDDNVVGYAGAEISTELLSVKLMNSSFYSGTYCIIYNSDKSTVVDSGSVSDMGVDVSSLVSSEYGFASPVSVGTNYYIKSRLTSPDWTLLMVFDGKVIAGNFNKQFAQQIMILICLFVLEIVAAINLIRHESKDIPEISGSIAEISAGNYNFRINSDSQNEIGLIANSVDKLAQTLQDKNAVIDDYVNLDPTTGLQNRYRMYEMINDLIISRDEARSRFALLFIDIDNFKWITEALGHRQGDEFLKVFGQRIKSITQRVYRFSGDEFVVLMDVVQSLGEVDEMIDKLKGAFERPIEILNSKIYAKFSVGVSVYPDDETNADMLLRDADIAVSHAKEKGKDRASYFNNNQHKNVLNKTIISQRLEKALERNELYLNYQPIVSVENGDIHGFEVLLRWESEELGSVSPADFVNIAEETGAIVKIGQWIFEMGCRRLKLMNEYKKDIIMSINVSPVQMRSPDFLNNVKRVIEITGVNPSNIQVEITEGSLVDSKAGSNVINELNNMGLFIALDDFGTGYSSMKYLKNYPIKTLKVDKSFVDEIGSKKKDYRITESIIDMVRNLGIKTVVEGVETIEQYNILVEMKCDYIQGFIMSKPLSESDSLEFLKHYDELHKSDKEYLEHNSNVLAAEKLERERLSQTAKK
ncbi:MAG: sensor domain-containing phosphodiesterase [Oscillospiraceae bacterium]|nr:sensor domain-containing phosphodiesterase [Oscillospiraceae bacterium]